MHPTSTIMVYHGFCQCLVLSYFSDADGNWLSPEFAWWITNETYSTFYQCWWCIVDRWLLLLCGHFTCLYFSHTEHRRTSHNFSCKFLVRMPIYFRHKGFLIDSFKQNSIWSMKIHKNKIRNPSIVDSIQTTKQRKQVVPKSDKIS